jgi:aryl-alcohol dehydrogenase-like predicted oxidoreductase
MTNLALGTVQFGLAYGVVGNAEPIGENEVCDILKLAHSAGVYRIDTAPAYGDIEHRLSRLAGDLDFEFISKITAQPEGATDQCIEKSISLSRARLGERLKGVIFHDSSNVEAHWAVAELFASEYGLRLGASFYDPAGVAKNAGKYSSFAMAQVPGNAFDQRVASIWRTDVEVTMRSAFLQGLLLVPLAEAVKRVPAAEKQLIRWHKWCANYGGDPLVLALRLAKGLTPDYIVVGVDSLKHLEEILVAWENSVALKAPELAVSERAVIDPRTWANIA